MECVNLAVIEVSVALSADIESGKSGFMTATFPPVDDLVERLVFFTHVRYHGVPPCLVDWK